MKRELKRKVDLFLKNRKLIKEEVKLESEYNYIFGAMMYTDEEKTISKKTLEKCYKLLKENTSLFSDFRTFSFPIIVKMSLTKNPKKYLEEMKNSYHLLTKNSIFGSYYKLITSMIVSEYEKDVEIDTLSKREKKIYDMMKKNHPFLTNDEDLAFATLFALSGKDEKNLIKEMEEYYDGLKDYISNKDKAQQVSEILTLLDGKKEDKLEKTIELLTILKENKKKVNQDFSLAVLASLSNLKEDSKTLVEDILAVDQYIGSLKGQGLWTLGKRTRLMISMLIVESLYCKNSRKLKGISLMNTIIIQEVLTLAICMWVLVID